MTLPAHGFLTCSRCFPTATWGETELEEDGWRLVNSPASWGATDPRVLVLGFSKAETQLKAFRRKPFDQVAYAGFRPNLTNVLRKLSLLTEDEDVGQRIAADERDFAFGSLIRCALSVRDDETGKYLSSGDIIKRSCLGKAPQDFIRACTETFLVTLPERLRVIVMLGNEDGYADSCFEAIGRIHSGVRRINKMAYEADGKVFVHVIHPAGTSGRHIPDWLHGSGGKQATKRMLAIDALASAGFERDW